MHANREKRALIVYLDSNDYSRLSDPKIGGSGQFAPIKQYLRNAIDQGAIDVRYSMAHVVEACHRDATSKKLALARASLMSEFSGPRVMKYFGRVLQEELMVRAPGLTTASIPLSDVGEWFPQMPNIGREIQDGLTDSINGALKTIPQNRRQRRFVHKLYGSPDNLKPGARKKLIEDPTKIDALCYRYGLSEDFVRRQLFQKIVRNENDHEATQRLVLSEIFEPIKFIGHYLDQFERNRAVRTSITTIGERLVSSAMESQEKVRQLVLQEGDQVRKFNAREEWRRLANKREPAFRAALVQAALKNIGSDLGKDAVLSAISSASDFGQILGLNCFVRAACEWLFDVIGQLGSLRKPKVSDAGDLIHMFYLPYVDLWRGDGYSAGVARRAEPNSTHKVVDDLEQLPSRIESALRRGNFDAK
jgi:hypothetical protein